MKRLGALMLLSCILVSSCAKESVEMDIVASHSMTADNWYKLDISIIVDEETASNKEACSKEIIQHILDNDFHSIRFSFDISGYPNEVSADIFISEKNAKEGKTTYSFKYITNFNTNNTDTQNNIKDNPDKFIIQYQ